MIELARYYLYIFGAAAIGGGVIGYVKAKSRASLLAGGISGALLCLAAYLISTGSVTGGLLLGLLQSAALAGRFVPAFLKSRKVMPAGLMAALGVGGVAITVLGLVVR